MKMKSLAKAALFLIFIRFLFVYLLILFSIPLLGIYFALSKIPCVFELMNKNYDFSLNLYFVIIPLISSPFACYYTGKIFGMFKFIDKFKNIYLKIFSLILITGVSFLISNYKFNFILDNNFINSNLNLSVEFLRGFGVFGFIPAYLLYKYFYYLTLKFPKPFKKAGYYFSMEFYKDLAKKV